MNDSIWQGKTVLITGVCGTIGKELLRQLIKSEAGEIVGLDNNESELFLLSEECRGCPQVRFLLGDLRDRNQLFDRFRGISIVLHTAALKHVILSEESPREAVQTNVIGTQNVIEAALANKVDRVLFTSSDKAVNPTNVMGTSKLMGERLMTAADAFKRSSTPIFASARFGNVLGSRGSVIPLFRRQIAKGGPVTLTDKAMTRFVMTLEEAVRLVANAAILARGGEVFVTKMAAIRIADLADVMIRELAPRHGFDPNAVDIEMIGSKPGEKLYEELLNEEETRRTVELEDFFVVLPAFKARGKAPSYPEGRILGVERAYRSSDENHMAPEALKDYLHQNGLLGE